ncbi:MAG: DUF1080 domain-containing protein [Acidobacteria bacterium]|nr:DUF1080 domain-containing protein [Acidobacteriota bacterium]
MKTQVHKLLLRPKVALWLVGIAALLNFGAQTRPPGKFSSLRLGDGREWAFIHGTWQEDAVGILTPPAQPADEHLAFHTARTFADFEAEFEFRWNIQGADAGFVFRAQDARHYYLVHFPCTGQQFRAAHFWAAISKVDESGWVKVLKMELVRGVPSEIGPWHKARLVVKGSEFLLWVDGRPFPVVRDSSYAKPGIVGLESFNGRDPGKGTPGVGDPEKRLGAGSSFRGLRIRGKFTRTAVWNRTAQPAQNWFYPFPDSTDGNWQYVSSLAKAPNGDLLLRLLVAEEHLGKSVPVLLRSSDHGRKWSGKQRLPESLREGAMHTSRDGRLRMHFIRSEPPFQILAAESKDNGKTWSGPSEQGKLEFPEKLGVARAYVGKVVELKDGTLVRFGYTVGEGPGLHGGKETQGRRYLGPITEADFSFCIRSTDGGQTWSTPVNIDGPNPSPGFVMDARETASEVSAAQTREGKILALIRPESSPWMWETWSEDGGRSWQPAARGPFPMYASTDSMSSTASGGLLIAGRHPGIAVQLSQDSGISWQCARIDTPFYANGATLEVEPNVILYIYDGKYSDPRARAQLLRVTPQGLEPVRNNP